MPISFYRYLAIFIFLCAGTAASFRTTIGYIIGTILFFLAIGVASDYKCPYCYERFDIRLGKRKLEHCPRCGEKINW